jgi:hypothetical protein
METIKLSAPVTVGERTVSELTIADPKVRHILAVDGHDPDSTAAAVALAASLTGESELIIRELQPVDWRNVRTRAMAIYYEFLGLDFTAAVVQAALAAGKKPNEKDPTAATAPAKA